jgi:hypothetical protein
MYIYVYMHDLEAKILALQEELSGNICVYLLIYLCICISIDIYTYFIIVCFYTEIGANSEHDRVMSAPISYRMQYNYTHTRFQTCLLTYIYIHITFI